MSDERLVTLALSGTRIEKAYRDLDRALGAGPLIPAQFDASRHDDRALAEARPFWHARMEAEHRSVGVFLLLGAQLIEANAPLDAKAVMLRMAQDELRHTEVCGRVLETLGGEPAVEMDVRIPPLATHTGASPEERAMRNVIYTSCMSEMIAVARLVDALEHTNDEFIRAATRAILADEVMHGQFGFLYLEASRTYLDEHPGVRASLTEYCKHAFAVLEGELAGPALAAASRPTPGAQALGVIDPRRAREVFENTIAHVIIPGLEQHGIDAGDAWRDRALAR